jgi:hypothetical protein
MACPGFFLDIMVTVVVSPKKRKLADGTWTGGHDQRAPDLWPRRQYCHPTSDYHAHQESPSGLRELYLLDARRVGTEPIFVKLHTVNPYPRVPQDKLSAL